MTIAISTSANALPPNHIYDVVSTFQRTNCDILTAMNLVVLCICVLLEICLL